VRLFCETFGRGSKVSHGYSTRLFLSVSLVT